MNSTAIAFDAIQPLINRLYGEPCCRQRIGMFRSLSLGFGKKIPHSLTSKVKSKMTDRFYGELELGTYNNAWRIVRDGKILCASQDVVDSLEELEKKLLSIKIGTLHNIKYISNIHIQICCCDNLYIDFLATSSDEDEFFHLFCPDNINLSCTASNGWSKDPAKITTNTIVNKNTS